VSEYNRTRKAEKLHRLGGGFLLALQVGALSILLYWNADLADQALFTQACWISVLPTALLAFIGGPFYRWCREAGQSRWLALLPTGLLTLWALTGPLLLGTLSEATEPIWMGTHGTLLGGVILSFAVVSINRRARKPIPNPSRSHIPTSEEMASVLTALQGFGKKSKWDEAIESLTQSARAIEWGRSGDAGEELAGALLALKGLVSDSLPPNEGSIEDGISVAERALQRVMKTTPSS